MFHDLTVLFSSCMSTVCVGKAEHDSDSPGKRVWTAVWVMFGPLFSPLLTKTFTHTNTFHCWKIIYDCSFYGCDTESVSVWPECMGFVLTLQSGHGISAGRSVFTVQIKTAEITTTIENRFSPRCLYDTIKPKKHTQIPAFTHYYTS